MRKTAIITGGSRGIGLAIARQLGTDGCNIVIFARHTGRCDSMWFLEKDIPFKAVDGDITSADDRKRLLDHTLEAFGRVDILVNDAGVAPVSRDDILKMSEESYDRVMDINTKGNMFMTQLVANQMIAQEKIFSRKGTIINISSCSSVVSSPNRAEYCVSKAGISMLTKLYADALAPYGVYVHEIRPGVIHSDMTECVEEKYSRLIEDGVFPIARWGEGADVASAVSVFASDELLYTTGNYIDVDGGFHIRSL